MRASELALIAAVSGVCACFVAEHDESTPCEKPFDCPHTVGYRCVSSRTLTQVDCGLGETGCLCEITFPPQPVRPDDAGPSLPTPDWCTDARPVIQRTCLANCHGVDASYPKAPGDFRLDYYDPPTPAGLPGVHAKAGDVRSAMIEYRMPPGGELEQPTGAERLLISRWVKGGAPLGDGGCERGDGG